MRPDPKRIAALNTFYEGQGAEVILAHAVSGLFGGRVALVSSFGAESVVLLHLMAQAEPNTPVLFADTQMLFAETLKYQQEVAETLGLFDIRRIAPDPAELLADDPARDLNTRNSDACCDLRKIRPLERALREFDVIISGRKRHQASTRAALPLFEQDADGRIKINPLANWARENVSNHLDLHSLPRHPLVAQGFPSLGCAPCTTPVAEGEDLRAGRWRGKDKEECGIHFIDGRAVRGPLTAA